MLITFMSVIDSISEGGVVSFVDRIDGYRVPQVPEDIAECLRHAFTAGDPVEVTYDDSSLEIHDARPGMNRV